jgi:hypothetical protein
MTDHILPLIAEKDFPAFRNMIPNWGDLTYKEWQESHST